MTHRQFMARERQILKFISRTQFNGRHLNCVYDDYNQDIDCHVYKVFIGRAWKHVLYLYF